MGEDDQDRSSEVSSQGVGIGDPGDPEPLPASRPSNPLLPPPLTPSPSSAPPRHLQLLAAPMIPKIEDMAIGSCSLRKTFFADKESDQNGFIVVPHGLKVVCYYVPEGILIN
ncbi:Protein CBG26811 [Caenorhabditis briggsae]|uniref:Protein CBG26811 n=1 Tax=Caenorhabditis briggsae TaxID=6238 RepID=B6IIC7_CAEBR|nr:Protein CBG26811 [Caenorhabditis briggsae]CAR99657.1 Protein CBG26811 [Caenorhabditis briggsae]